MKNIVLSQDFFPKIGGAHLWLYEVYKRWPSSVNVLTQDYSLNPSFSKQQNEFDLVNHGALNIIRKNIEIDDVDLFSFNCIKKYLYIFKNIRAMSGQDTVTLHCIRAFPEGIAGIFFKLLYKHRCKLIVYVHGEEILSAKVSRQLAILGKVVYSLADLIIANSNFTTSLLKDFSPSANVVTIHPGVDVEAFDVPDDAKQACRNNLSWPKDTTVLTTIARLEPHKNHASVIRAIAQLRAEGNLLGYVIIGDGPERMNLQKLSKDLGIEKWVKFVGQMSDNQKRIMLAASDIHVLPTIWGESIEGFGIAFLEAAAAKLPSISGNIGGQPEAVLHGKTGLVVNGKNLRDLKQAIKVLTNNRQLRKKLGYQGYLWAKQNDWEVVKNKTFRIIQENLK